MIDMSVDIATKTGSQLSKMDVENNMAHTSVGIPPPDEQCTRSACSPPGDNSVATLVLENRDIGQRYLATAIDRPEIVPAFECLAFCLELETSGASLPLTGWYPDSGAMSKNF